MAQDNAPDNEILPASGEDELHLGISLLELKFLSCRYVVRYGNLGEAFYCGEVIHRVSYCKHHYSACYIPTPKKN